MTMMVTLGSLLLFGILLSIAVAIYTKVRKHQSSSHNESNASCNEGKKNKQPDLIKSKQGEHRARKLYMMELNISITCFVERGTNYGLQVSTSSNRSYEREVHSSLVTVNSEEQRPISQLMNKAHRTQQQTNQLSSVAHRKL